MLLTLHLSDLAFSRVLAFAGKGETSIASSLRGDRACTPKKLSRLFPHEAHAREKARS